MYFAKKMESSKFDDSYEQVQNIEVQIEENKEQLQTLIHLMSKGFLEPAIFNEHKIELQRKSMELKDGKKGLYQLINGGITQIEELKKLLKFLNKKTNIQSYEDKIFENYVEKIIAYSPTAIGFQLKCGITLKERIDR